MRSAADFGSELYKESLYFCAGVLRFFMSRVLAPADLSHLLTPVEISDYWLKIWHKVVVLDNGCWEYPSNTKSRDRAVLSWNGKHTLVTRIVWEMLYGEIAKNLNVCHTCDYPKCVNPDHLWLGTNKENIQDASRKGRMKFVGRYKKLSKEEETVVFKSSESVKKLAEIYAVTPATIYNIRKRLSQTL